MGHTSSSTQPGPLPGLPCSLFPLGSVGHLNLSFISCLCYLEEQLEQVTEKRIKAATLSCVIKDKAHLTANNSDTQPALHIIHCLWTPSYVPSTCLEVTEYVPWAVFWEVPWGFCWLFFYQNTKASLGSPHCLYIGTSGNGDTGSGGEANRNPEFSSEHQISFRNSYEHATKGNPLYNSWFFC